MTTIGTGTDRNGQTSGQAETEAEAVQPPHELELVRAMTESVTPDDWREIVLACVERAKAGDGRARAWLASYLLGKPRNPSKKLRELENDFEWQKSKEGRELAKLFSGSDLPGKIDP